MTRQTRHSTRWTYAEYARLPDDGNRYEVIDQEVLVTPAPSPRHQHVAALLFRRLSRYVERHRLGVVLWDVDLLFASGQFLRPDLVFVTEANHGGLSDRGVESVPALIVEVLSPSSGSIDRVKKPPRYADFGVPEYWVVDPDAHALLTYDLTTDPVSPRTHVGRLVWRPDEAVPPMVLRVSKIFAPL